MTNKKLKRNITYFSLFILFFFVVFLLTFAFTNKVSAQKNSKLVLTWKALNFYPSDYRGKAKATEQSDILVSATYLKNGSFVQNENIEYRWFVDGNLYTKGVDLKEIKVDMSNFEGSSQFIRVEAIKNGETIEGSAKINLDDPEVVIRSSAEDRTLLKPGEKIKLTAVPYFFDVSSFENLSFYWKINGETQNNTTNKLNLDLSSDNQLSGKRILVSSIVSNQKTKMEVIEERVLFEIK